MQIIRDGKYLALAFGPVIFQIRDAFGEAGPLVNLAEWLDTNEPKSPAAPQHVCGIRGYDGMKDPPCPACDPTFREQADRVAHGKLVRVIEETGERHPYDQPGDLTDVLLYTQNAKGKGTEPPGLVNPPSDEVPPPFKAALARVNEKYAGALKRLNDVERVKDLSDLGITVEINVRVPETVNEEMISKIMQLPLGPNTKITTQIDDGLTKLLEDAKKIDAGIRAGDLEKQREGMLNYTPGPRQARMVRTQVSEDRVDYTFDPPLTVRGDEELKVDFTNQTAEIMPPPSDGPKRSASWIPTVQDQFYNTQLGVPYHPGEHPDSEKPLDLTGTKSSSEWADLCGIVIHDADGYRDGVMISDPITWDEFKPRVLQCTIRFPKKPNQYYEALTKR